MSNSNLDRILEVDKVVQDQVVTQREITTLIFESRENAKRASELLGTTGTFSYQTDSGECCWLPGIDDEELSKHCAALKTSGEGAFKYKDPDTQEYFYYQRQGVHKKDGKQLIFVGRSDSNVVKAIMALFRSKF